MSSAPSSSTFSHVALLVSDLDRTCAWYADVLGWSLTFCHRFDEGELGDANGFTGAVGEVATELAVVPKAS